VVATVGLVAAVPLTTALAAFVCGSAQPAAPASEAVPSSRGRARHRRVDAGEALAPDHSGPSW
jgi:hypothetical protein